jgi:hypothetical protein
MQRADRRLIDPLPPFPTQWPSVTGQDTGRYGYRTFMLPTAADVVHALDVSGPTKISVLADRLGAQRVSDVTPVVMALLAERALDHVTTQNDGRVLTITPIGWERYLT